MAVLSARVVTRSTSGVLLAAAAAAGGGDSFVNTGKEFLYVKNGGGGAITVTIAIPLLVDGVTVATGKTASIGAGEERLFGPFSTAIYNDGNGSVAITYSGVTTVTVAIVSSTPTG